ncbi:MAG TPA: hypothetical protein VJR89_31480, partial [Polyangiales bacterium]|nr:hypothetical protein [Polyangiales bacterium]
MRADLGSRPETVKRYDERTVPEPEPDLFRSHVKPCTAKQLSQPFERIVAARIHRVLWRCGRCSGSGRRDDFALGSGMQALLARSLAFCSAL